MGAIMPKPTLQQRLIEALIATGRGTRAQSRSRKYVTLKRPDGSFYFVGKAGALRFGKRPASPRPRTSSVDCWKRTRRRTLTMADAAGLHARR
jgi:hypothetical protein